MRHRFSFIALLLPAVIACSAATDSGEPTEDIDQAQMAGAGESADSESPASIACGGNPVPECNAKECGPAPMMPNQICSNGTLGGPTGRCLKTLKGCVWEICTCPEKDSWSDQGGR